MNIFRVNNSDTTQMLDNKWASLLGEGVKVLKSRSLVYKLHVLTEEEIAGEVCEEGG